MRIVHYLNQFFGGIGGEEHAGVRPEVRPGPVGPGQALKAALGDAAEIVATVICGDSWFNENLEEAKATVLELIRQHNPDLVVAGPAFNAGRYGMACGAVAEVVSKQLGIPVVTGMYKENPGVEVYRRYAWVVETGNSAASMRQAIQDMANLIKRLAAGLEPEPGTYLERGLRVNAFAAERGSARAVEMLVRKLRGEPFTTEYPMPSFDRVPPNPPVKDLSKAKIALVTSGGIVPKGNPDHIESSSASKYGKYYLGDLDDLTAETHQTAHGGYDPTYANADPDRVLPVDVMRELEREGVIGKLHDYWYATVGNGTSVANARAYARAIAEDLRKYEVDAVILTST
ncbi:MAG: beta-aspartate methyltransferase [Symbiobacterium thermophilum]|uniref:Beta-aspartate methyltransferase n=1 Tax=Symbiobacterium thermophilum TaxID=2734 RepID=A0A1Y2T6H4_SYMTR|nr:MAG: beta-aspartate methyltransferase [Symbiobacterium thermophilum]